MTSAEPGGRDVRAIFSVAAEAFVEVVGGLDPARLDAAATSAWTLAELVAHATRGLSTVASTVAAQVDPDSRELESGSAYFRAAMSLEGVHDGIVRRARESRRPSATTRPPMRPRRSRGSAPSSRRRRRTGSSSTSRGGSASRSTWQRGWSS